MRNDLIEEPHIGFSCPDKFTETYISQLIEEVETLPLTVSVQKREQEGPYAAMEWALPTAIAVYLAKPFFESFLSEAGKDVYTIAKGWIKKILLKGREIKTHVITASQSTEKTSKTYHQSRSISIVIQLKNKTSITLLFDENLSTEDWENAIESLLDFIVANYNNMQIQDPSESSLPPELRPPLHLYGIIHPPTKQWNFYTGHQLARMQFEQSRKGEN